MPLLTDMNDDGEDFKTCGCGSGKEMYELFDARGIYCCRVCEDCEEKKKARYRPEIFTDSNYYTDEPIDEGEY
jgi:hypothetical protein